MTGSTTPKARSAKKKKNLNRSRAYSPKAEAQAFADENGLIAPSANGADIEFGEAHSALLNLATPAVDVLGIANVIECELELNPEYNSFCFKLDGGAEFNVVPNIINEMCITAEGSPELPRKCMLLKVEDELVVAHTHDYIVEKVKAVAALGSNLKVTLSPLAHEQDDVPTIQDVLTDTNTDELTKAIISHIRVQVHNLTTPYTTRPIKEGEEEGVEYHFIHEAVFKKMVREKSFVEHTKDTKGFMYGSPFPKATDIEQERHNSRSESLREKSSPGALEEATVLHVLEKTEIAPEIMQHLKHHNVGGTKASDLSLTNFLEAIDHDDEDLADVREHVKNAIYEITVPVTTRAKREGELDGREYNFVSVADFKALIEADRLLEYGVHNSALYGTLKIDKAAAHPQNRIRRSETLQKALVQKHKGAKVGELMKFSDERHTEIHDSVAHHSVAHFLSSVPQNDPIYSELRSKVKGWLYDCTIPYTTRDPRDAEVHGRDYHFVSVDEFQDMVNHERFIEFGQHNGNWYGTLHVDSSHVEHTAENPRPSRSSVKRSAHEAGYDDVKVHHVLGGENTIMWDGRDHDLEKHHSTASLADFFKAVPDDHRELAATRDKVKIAVYDVTVPVTTRAPREGERNGRNYHFVTRDRFTGLCVDNKMLEFGVHNGELYGTLKPTIDEIKNPRFKRSSKTGSMDGSNTMNEATMDHLKHLLKAPTSDTHAMLPISQFFAHVGPHHEDHADLRAELKDLIYDMTVPYTTRIRREGEKEGACYHFVTVEEFKRLYDEDFFFEHGQVDGAFYGSPKLTLDHLDEDRKPKMSRRANSAAQLENARGEVTLDHFASKHGLADLDDHRKIPLSMYLSRVDEGHREHAEVRAQVKSLVYEHSIPYTTRPRREGEMHGREYFFVTEEEFEAMIASHGLLEYGQRDNGFWYGTPVLMEEHVTTPDPYQRSAHMAEVAASKQGHAKLKDLLRGENHPALSTLGDMTLSDFLARVDPDDDELGDLRENLKATMYMSTTPYTTRRVRPGEQNGVEYNFVTREQFLAKIEADELLEWGEHNGEFYGTPHLHDHEYGDGKVDTRLDERNQQLAKSLKLAVNQSPAAREAYQHLQDALAREEQLNKRVDEIKALLATADEDHSHDDLKALVNKLHLISHDLDGSGSHQFSSMTPSVPTSAAAAPRVGDGAGAARRSTGTLEPMKVLVEDKTHADLRKQVDEHQATIDEHKTQLAEANGVKAKLEAEVADHRSTIDALKVQSAVMDITETLSKLDNLHDMLKTVANAGPVAPPAAAAAAAAATTTTTTEVRKARTLPTVTGAKAWENPTHQAGISIKEKLAARRNWQAGAAASTMSPLKAKLAARRRAKAAGTLSSTGNATPAMALLSSSLQQQQQPTDDSSGMASKPLSPSTSN
jgi:guanylate kinase